MKQETIASNATEASVFISKIDTFPVKITVSDSFRQRTINQNSLFHSWASQLSEYLIAKGRKDSSPEFCKDLLKHSLLGYETKIMTDCITGLKTEISSLRHTSDLKTGEMFHFMELVDRWCISIGLMLTTPDNSEYKKLKDEEQ